MVWNSWYLTSSYLLAKLRQRNFGFGGVPKKQYRQCKTANLVGRLVVGNAEDTWEWQSVKRTVRIGHGEISLYQYQVWLWYDHTKLQLTALNKQNRNSAVLLSMSAVHSPVLPLSLLTVHCAHCVVHSSALSLLPLVCTSTFPLPPLYLYYNPIVHLYHLDQRFVLYLLMNVV